MTRIHQTILDLREASPALVRDVLQQSPNAAIYATAWQLTSGVVPPAHRGEVSVCVPDFLHYGRLLSTGQAARLLQLPVSKVALVRAIASSGWHVATSPKRLLAKEFWLVAEALMLYDIALLGRRAPTATLMLHPYLTDFALAFQRQDFLARFARTTAKRGRAWGVHTAQYDAAASGLSRLGLNPQTLMIHTGPDALDFAFLHDHISKHQPLKEARVVADSTGLPAQALEVADARGTTVATQLILPTRNG